MTDAPDLRSPAFFDDPFPVLRGLLEENPLHWNPSLGGWVAVRYGDIREQLRDRRFSSDRMDPFFAHLAADDRAGLASLEHNIRLWSVFNDPPEHTRLRGLMNKAFTSRALKEMRPKVERIAGELVEGIAAKGRMETIADLAYPLPASVIGLMLGVPWADIEHLKRWSDDLAKFVLYGMMGPAEYRRADAAIAEMTAYFTDLIAERRRNPGDDVVSGLVGAEERGDFLSVDELVATCVLLLFAGHETTTQLIGNGLLALLQNPAELERLRSLRHDPEAVAIAVEEMLRFDGPSLAQVRLAGEDIPLPDGQVMRAGDRVFQMLAAANRDPQQFADPDRFDVGRADAKAHLAFGYGIHFCIGAPLARMEGQILFPILLERLADLQLETEVPRFTRSLVVRGLTALPVSFRVQ
ncbi:cytochrome P450 [Marinibaculum pumilum]|uniref:Cytochrome P450 n=1 Tax=Marinibaculum pumilum TaxID=1766165 RepID=A0ABV7L9H0_9PROT